MKGQTIRIATAKPIKFWQGSGLFLTWILVLISGTVLVNSFAYGWAVAALLFLLGISIPILTIVWAAGGGLATGSRRRVWSVFGYGLVGGTVIAVIVEYLLIGLALAVIGILAVSNVELRTVIDQIRTQVASAKAGDMQTLLTVLAPYITNPIVILSILLFAAVLTPLIEEAVKPAIIWFLGKSLQSPAEGFLLGALCGAGFAMLEGLMAASGATQTWGFGLAGRAAASLMHISGSGILGWGIASAQLEKRYSRLALTYLIAVSIHGLWNGSAIIAVYGGLRMMVQNTIQLDIPSTAMVVIGIGLLFLELILMLTALPLINRRLRRVAAPSATGMMQSDIISPTDTQKSRETNGLDS